MIKVKEAINIIVSNASPLKEETIPIEKSLGRITSRNIYAKLNNPPTHVSSMDGYAIRLVDLENLKNMPIKIVGESAAGKPYLNKLKNNECIQIFTGAVVPKYTNLILVQERVKIKNNFIISTDQNYFQGQYIRSKGSNFKEKSLIIKKNNSITSRIVGLAISSNNSKINVYKKLNIAILATGNELKNLNTNNKNGIISSNTPLLQSLINCFGAQSHDLGIARDTFTSLKLKLKNINKYDVLITTGGASVGKHDLVKDALKELGMKLIFWKVAMRPGKPLIFGKLKNTLVLGFPGNPVSTFVSTLIFLKPLICKYLNIKNDFKIKDGILTKNLNSNDEREEYLRAKIISYKNTYKVEPLSGQDSSMTSYLSNSNGLIIRKPYDKALRIGNRVSIIIFSDLHPYI